MRVIGPGARLAVVLALVLGVGPTSQADEAMPTAGASGIGDPYFPYDGNGGIDVLHYDVHDSYGFRARRLAGRTTLTITATQPLSRFNLDLLLPVRSVLVDGVAAPYSKPNAHELQITPPVALATGQTFEVTVEYAGRPGRIGWGNESHWVASAGEVVAVNQPHMAAWWFAANDHPSDKATMDVAITVPKRKVVISNGERVARRIDGAMATTRWRSREPMAPYLAFFAAGSFHVEWGTRRGLPWLVAVSKAIPDRDFRRSLKLMRRSARLTSWLQGQLGPYPFSSTGGVTTSLTPGFALETQSRPVYPVMSQGATSTVIHELAHQWFGDSVALAQWRDVWLNEGAATFMEVRRAEAVGGRSGEQWLQQVYAQYYRDTDFWRLRLDDPGARRLFDDAVYIRGAMALQALRTKVGEKPFWILMRRWVADHRGGNASTEQFEELAREITGVDLGDFFDVWLRARSRPARIAANGLSPVSAEQRSHSPGQKALPSGESLLGVGPRHGTQANVDP